MEPFAIYFLSDKRWQSHYPDWARNGRDRIIARIKERFKQPRYEYREVDDRTFDPNSMIEVILKADSKQ